MAITGALRPMQRTTWKKPGRPAMAVAEEVMMRKVIVLLPTRKKDLPGTTASGQASVTGPTENLLMILKRIFPCWKDIFALTIPAGMKACVIPPVFINGKENLIPCWLLMQFRNLIPCALLMIIQRD